MKVVRSSRLFLIRLFSARLLLICAALVVALPMTSCKRTEPPQVKTLPGGKEIKILSMKLAHLDGGGRGLIMVYESALPFDQKQAIVKELNEVWTGIKNTATHDEDVRYVSITAQSEPKGFVLASRESVEIVLHKYPNDTWGPNPQ